MTRVMKKVWAENRALAIGLMAGGGLAILLLALIKINEKSLGERTADELLTWLAYATGLMAAMLASDLIAGEVDGETMVLLITKPVSRGAIWAGKWFGGFVMTQVLAYSWVLILLLTHLVACVTGGQPIAGWEGIVASLPKIALAVALGHATGFLISTVVSRRLDALLASVMTVALLAAAIEASPLRGFVLAGILSGIFAWASYFPLRYGEALRTGRRQIAAGLALLVGLGAGIGSLQFSNWIELVVLSPQPVNVSNFEPLGSEWLAATFQVEPRGPNFFRSVETRVAVVPVSGAVPQWVPARWVRSLGGEPPNVVLMGREQRLGCPLRREVSGDYRMGDLGVNWHGSEDSTDTTPERSRFRIEVLGSSPGPHGWRLHRRAPSGEVVAFEESNSTILASWFLETEVVLFARRDGLRGGIFVMVLDSNGGSYHEERFPVHSDSGLTDHGYGSRRLAGIAMRTEGLVGFQSLSSNTAGVVHVTITDRRPILRTIASNIRPGYLLSSVDQGWLLGSVSAANDGDDTPRPGAGVSSVYPTPVSSSWRGSLELFDGSGRELHRSDLGLHTRAAELAVARDYRRAVVRLGRGIEGTDSHALLDLATFDLKPVLENADIPPRFGGSIRWLDDRRFVHATKRSLVVNELGPDGNLASRPCFSF